MKNRIIRGRVDSSAWSGYIEALCSGFPILVPKNIYMPHDANLKIFAVFKVFHS